MAVKEPLILMILKYSYKKKKKTEKIMLEEDFLMYLQVKIKMFKYRF